jgi:hypothetical protein
MVIIPQLAIRPDVAGDSAEENPQHAVDVDHSEEGGFGL